MALRGRSDEPAQRCRDLARRIVETAVVLEVARRARHRPAEDAGTLAALVRNPEANRLQIAELRGALRFVDGIALDDEHSRAHVAYRREERIAFASAPFGFDVARRQDHDEEGRLLERAHDLRGYAFRAAEPVIHPDRERIRAVACRSNGSKRGARLRSAMRSRN